MGPSLAVVRRWAHRCVRIAKLLVLWTSCSRLHRNQSTAIKAAAGCQPNTPVLTVGHLEAAASRHKVESLAEHQVWTCWLCLQ